MLFAFKILFWGLKKNTRHKQGCSNEWVRLKISLNIWALDNFYSHVCMGLAQGMVCKST